MDHKRTHAAQQSNPYAYEYLLRKFAEGSGQSAGEFLTPTEVGFLMAHIMRPRPGEDCHDYACGSAGLLMKLQLVARELDPTSKVPLKLTARIAGGAGGADQQDRPQ